MITNPAGVPVQLIDPETATTRSLADTELWGDTSWRGASSIPLRYPGQIYDAETGLHYNLNRSYDPQTGRFLTSDPLGLGPAPNPRAYPHNPTAWPDPLGLVPRSATR
ncbi:RHS repeat-associated core domain-containing protein [Nocardia sp. alder85J]|uniref:RHS repeat-associated core domain-containing protein n=1 Tax=Nocardia sp. alder85J TaxID=2862949 RepID=UPI001CD62365